MTLAASLIVAVALAAAIGANNAGVNMAAPYGALARGRLGALVLYAVFSMLGAVVLSPPVLKTVGKELLTQSPPTAWMLTVTVPLIGLACIAAANFLRVPIPTTPAILAAIIGLGACYEILNLEKTAYILAWWAVSGASAFLVTFVFCRLLRGLWPRLLDESALSERTRKTLALLLTLNGCFAAFAIGANNAANAVGPLVRTGLVEIYPANLVAGGAFAAGALLWGSRVLETLGRGITWLSLVRAFLVGSTASTSILVASVKGVPISSAIITTAGVLGFWLAGGRSQATASRRNVRKIALLWATAPAMALGLAYLLSWIAK